MNITQDCIIGYRIENPNPNVDVTLEYSVPVLGKVVLTPSAYEVLLQNLEACKRQPELEDRYPRHILAGIARNAFELGNEPPVFDIPFIEEGYKQLDLPASFEQKCQHLLRHLYQGLGLKAPTKLLRSARDYPLTYSDPDAFVQVVDELDMQRLITYRKREVLGATGVQFVDVQLTELGREAVEAEHP